MAPSSPAAHVTLQGISLDVADTAFGCVPSTRRATVPFLSVIDAAAQGDLTRVTFLAPQRGDASSKIATQTVRLSVADGADVEADGGRTPAPAPDAIMARAWPGPRNLRLYVLINPHGGTGDAREQYERHAAPVFTRVGAKATVEITTHHGHARELARTVDIAAFDAIVCVSGDGLPHEVLNGLAERADAGAALRVPVAQLPGGSGNAMSHSLTGAADWATAALHVVKGAPLAVDLMRVSQAGRVYYSFLSQSFGIVADADLGTEGWRWMGGARFTVGVVLKALGGACYPAEIAYKLAPEQAGETPPPPHEAAEAVLKPRYGDVGDPLPEDWAREQHPSLACLYVGNMPYMAADAIVFPHAQPADGAMDMIVWDATVGRLQSLGLLMKMESGAHAADARANYRKVVAYRLTPQTPNYLSVDGETYEPTPLQVEVLPRAATLLSPLGAYAHARTHARDA